MDQIYGNTDDKMDIDDFVLSKMESDYVLLIAIIMNGPNYKHIADIPRRFIVKDTLVTDWVYKHSKINMLQRYVIETMLSKWTESLPYFDIAFHCSEIHNINNVLRINISRAWYNNDQSFNKIDIDGVLLSTMFDLDEEPHIKYDICDDIKYVFRNYSTIMDSFPVGTCYSVATPPTKDQVLRSLDLLVNNIHSYTMRSIYEKYHVRKKVLESCHEIINMWINYVILTTLQSKTTVYDTTDLLQLMHCVFQLNRYSQIREITESEWRGLYE